MKKLAVVVAVLLLAAGCGSDDGGDEASPEDVALSYVAAYNDRDIDAVVDAFAEDADIDDYISGTGSQATDTPTVIRAEALGEWSEDAMLTWTVTNVEGNTIVFDVVFESAGSTNCFVGSEVDVEDGKITAWRFGPSTQCPA